MNRFFLLACFAAASTYAGSDALAQTSETACRIAVEAANYDWETNDTLEACAKGGDADAEAILGMLYWSAWSAFECDDDSCIDTDPYRGGLDPAMTRQDLQREGLRLIESAANKGQPEAQNEMGIALLDGDYDLVPDYEAARQWLEKSTEGGDIIGPFNLSRMYFAGLGVPKSPEKAEHLLKISALRGYGPARCSLMRYLEDKGDMHGALMRWTIMVGAYCGDDQIMPDLPVR